MAARFHPLPSIAVVAAAVLLAGCGATEPPAGAGPAPERIVLHYDYAGSWAAAAGDACAARLDLSDVVFLSVSAASGDGSAFHIADFFLLEAGEPAVATVAVPDPDGALVLSVDTRGVVDGRPTGITYRLRLEPDSPLLVRLTSMVMAVRGAGGRPEAIDLLSAARSDPGIPVFGAAGKRGLCLKRQPP